MMTCKFTNTTQLSPFPAALKPAFKLDDLEDAIWQFDEELKQFGPNLKDLIHNKGKVCTHDFLSTEMPVCTCHAN
jgi:hypothetical protein